MVYRLLSSSRNAADLYLQPFSHGLWLAVLALMAVCILQLVATTRSWTQPEHTESTWARAPYSVADCVTAVVGGLCQQGARRPGGFDSPPPALHHVHVRSTSLWF